MKDFLAIQFDVARCAEELRDFRRLLDSKKELEEGADIKPFFEAHSHLSALLGAFHWSNSRWDRIAFQYQLFGDFACDLVVGDSAQKVYVFVEFEDGLPTSLFRRQGEKSTPEWGSRVERAFSQIVDWFWKLDDMARTDDFEVRLGARHVDYCGVIVAGRDEWLAHSRERRRWDWRSQKVLVNGFAIRCVTYDQLYNFLAGRLEAMYPSLLREVEQSSPPVP